MTQEQDPKPNKLVPVARDQILTAAPSVLSTDETEALTKYIQKGGHELAPETIAKFFELYLNGSDCQEIHRLNKPFPLEAILWAKVKYHWDLQKEEYIINRQMTIKDKVMRAQLEATDLVSDMLVAARKKHGDRLKKYIQTGDEADLGGAITIDSLHSLIKTIEGLLRITGQDRQVTSRTINENKQTVSVNLNTSTGAAPANLEPEDAAKILSVIAEAKRRGSKDGK